MPVLPISEGLSSIVKRLRRAARSGDRTAFLSIKAEFYAVILDGCRNSLVKETLNGLYARINFLRATSLQQEGRLAKSVAEIESLQRSIEDRDAAAATRKAAQHVRNAQRAIMGDGLGGAASQTKAPPTAPQARRTGLNGAYRRAGRSSRSPGRTPGRKKP